MWSVSEEESWRAKQQRKTEHCFLSFHSTLRIFCQPSLIWLMERISKVVCFFHFLLSRFQVHVVIHWCVSWCCCGRALCAIPLFIQEVSLKKKRVRLVQCSVFISGGGWGRLSLKNPTAVYSWHGPRLRCFQILRATLTVLYVRSRLEHHVMASDLISANVAEPERGNVLWCDPSSTVFVVNKLSCVVYDYIWLLTLIDWKQTNYFHVWTALMDVYSPSTFLLVFVSMSWPTAQTMCWSALWDTPLRLLPLPLSPDPPFAAPPPNIPTPFMCFKQSGNGNIPLLIHAHTHTHTCSFLLCSGPCRTRVGAELMDAFPIDYIRCARLSRHRK